jgi:hypothetical protein
MGTFNGKVKKVMASGSGNDYSIIIEVEDSTHSVGSATVTLPVKANPNPVPCAHSGENAGVCRYLGSTKTANPISGSSMQVIVKLFDESGNLLLQVPINATVESPSV